MSTRDSEHLLQGREPFMRYGVEATNARQRARLAAARSVMQSSVERVVPTPLALQDGRMREHIRQIGREIGIGPPPASMPEAA